MWRKGHLCPRCQNTVWLEEPRYVNRYGSHRRHFHIPCTKWHLVDKLEARYQKEARKRYASIWETQAERKEWERRRLKMFETEAEKIVKEDYLLFKNYKSYERYRKRQRF